MRLGSHVLLGLLVFLVFLLIALAVRKAIRAAIARMSTQGQVDHIVAQLAYVAVLAIGAVAALSAGFGVNVTALVASLGLAGFAIGFAVKDVLSNSLAGVLILVQRPFTIGDEVALAGAEGRVAAVRVRDTLIKTGEGTLVYVPNSIIFNSIVTNKSAYGVRLVTCRFKCAGAADTGNIINICSSLLNDRAEILKSPPPQVLLNELSGDGLGFQVKFWIEPQKSSADVVRSTVLLLINDALLKKGLRLLNADEVAD
ncbi:MAG: mechanosensitive ion channel family protein [Actinomycetota bacterium]|nr:mechanosensitive ion channel family protein [Actinomycetota bacterium]